MLDRTLRLCVAAWEGEHNSFSANILKGTAKLIVSFGDSMRDDIFKEKIGALSPKELGRIARERRRGTIGYAEAMLATYNAKMKYPLKWEKLYSSSA